MRNLAAHLYVDATVFARERDAIFARSWQLLGPVDAVAEPGRYLSVEIAGLKVFALRGRDGALRAFRNVCRHRGARILPEGEGSCAALRCPYHNWLYDETGALRSAPWFGEDDDLRLEDWPLEPVSAAQWRGLLFLAIDPAGPLEAQLGAAVPALAAEPIERYRAVRRERLVFDANWKIYTDNFVEGYHIPGIHPEFRSAIDFERFETRADDGLVLMTAPPREGLFYRGTWMWMWPNWTLSLFAGGMNTSRINPLGPDRTELVYHFYFEDISQAARAARDDTVARNLEVVRQDFEICEETHKNYATGAYAPGPLSPRHERGVAYFQGRVAESLAL